MAIEQRSELSSFTESGELEINGSANLLKVGIVKIYNGMDENLEVEIQHKNNGGDYKTIKKHQIFSEEDLHVGHFAFNNNDDGWKAIFTASGSGEYNVSYTLFYNT